MKKLLIALAIVALTWGVTGCGSDTGESPKHTAITGAWEDKITTGITIVITEDTEDLTVALPSGEVIYRWKKEASE